MLGPLETTTILVGSVIGSGIFLVPNTIASQLGSFGLIIIVWLISGLLTLFGALSYAELGGIIPHAGGQYAYLREAYGKLPAFLFGWTEFLVIKAGSIAAVAVAFALYFGHFIPEAWQDLFHQTVQLKLGLTVTMEDFGVKVVAIICILLISTVNYLGVKFGGWVQNVFTFLKVGALVALIGLTFIFGHPAENAFQPIWGPINASVFSAIGVAMVAALWAFDGWNNTTYVAAEVREPQRNIPRALFLGTTIVITVYLFANFSYAYLLPISSIAQSKLVAADAIKTFMGDIGAALISAAVMISTFGTVNGMILSGSRITYAMARDKIFFYRLGQVHPRFRTPHISLVVQGIWSALLTLTGRFDQLFTYVIFAAWLFYAMTTGAVFVLRKKWPQVERPYKTWGYPYVPISFIIVSVLFVVNTLIADPRDSLFGLIIVILGLPVYFYWNKKSKDH